MSNIRTVYEHHRTFQPQLDGHSLHFPKVQCRTLRECLRSWSSQGKVTVHDLSSDSFDTTLQSAQRCRDEVATSEVTSVCGDLDGNAFLATRAGYKVRLSTHQPFAYCDEPSLRYCQSSAVVSIFEPDSVAAGSYNEDPIIPDNVLRDDLYKMMRCHSQMHSRTRRCMEGYIQDRSGEELRQNFVLTQILNSALNDCES